MAKTFTAPFAQTPKTNTGVVTAATTITSDAPAGTVLLVTAGADGSVVTALHAMPRTTVTASDLALFISKDGGTTKQFIDSALMSAYTSAATTSTPVSTFSRISDSSPLRLAAGDTLYVGSQVALAGGIVFAAEWMDY